MKKKTREMEKWRDIKYKLFMLWSGAVRMLSCHRWIMGVLLHSDDSRLGRKRMTGI